MKRLIVVLALLVFVGCSKTEIAPTRSDVVINTSYLVQIESYTFVDYVLVNTIQFNSDSKLLEDGTIFYTDKNNSIILDNGFYILHVNESLSYIFEIENGYISNLDTATS